MKQKWNKGFTLLEMLIVVAIIAILVAVAAVAVDRNQKSMYQLEFDGMAREIYFAAQNHLTQADTQGELSDLTTVGQLGTNAPNYKNEDSDPVEKKDVYYIAGYQNANHEAVAVENGTDILKLMLPKDAIDAVSSRGNGTFFIIYQKSTATVLDVFYTSTDSRFGLPGYFKANDYNSLKGLRGDSQRSARRNYNGAILGYYGGENAQNERITLKAPELKVENGDRLKLIVTNPNTDASVLNFATLTVFITGVQSGKSVSIPLLTTPDATGSSAPTATTEGHISISDDYSKIEIVLDDITVNSKDTKGHFAIKYPELIPGEDIQVQAKAYSTNRFSNIVWSATALTNSLFADPYKYTEGQTVLGSAVDVDNGVAAIASFRHLENLDGRISDLRKNDTDSKVKFKKAAQIADIDWETFRTNVGNNDVKPIDTDVGVSSGCYVPVTHQYFNSDSSNPPPLAYDGQNHSVSNVKVDFKGNAGLFGTIPAGGSAKNLKLIDFSINTKEGAYDTGALVGSITETDADKIVVSNVLAINSSGTGGKDTNFDNDDNTTKAPNVNAQGNAGGLIGSMTGGTVEKSAAALYVKSTGSNAGGLIGTSSGGTVRLSYSGGHTYSGKADYTGATEPTTPRNSKNTYPVRYYDAKNDPMYNVTATGTSGIAGGLIGSASGTEISYSYSTCSASAETAGGFIGSANGGSISNSYCTGLIPEAIYPINGVSAANAHPYRGAFAGSLSNITPVTGCQYFEIVNEYRDTKGENLTSGYHYATPLPKTFDTEGKETFDGKNTNITAIDASASSYNGFSGASTGWAEAHPYDAGGSTTASLGLGVFYKGTDGKTHYNLQTVQQLEGASSTVAATDFVSAHYGDWPAPEEFIFN